MITIRSKREQFSWYQKGAKGAKAPAGKAAASKKEVKIPANLPDLDKDMDSCELFSTVTSLLNDTNDEGVNSVDLSRDEPMMRFRNLPHFKSLQIMSYHYILCHSTSSSITSRQIASFKKKFTSNCITEDVKEAALSKVETLPLLPWIRFDMT